MSMLNWQWHTGLTLSEREPEVGSSQAEFNDGELVRPFTDLCPPLAHGLALKSQRQPMEEHWLLPKASSPGPLDFVQNTKC